MHNCLQFAIGHLFFTEKSRDTFQTEVQMAADLLNMHQMTYLC